MTKPLFLRSNHLYHFGLIVLVTGLPLSLFLISVSQFILAGSFFLEGNFIHKFKRFFHNKAALLVAGIWLMHLLGQLWTTNLTQGWNDIRIKLPLLVLTIIMAGSDPLSRKQFFMVLSVFTGAVFAGTLVSMAVLMGIIDREIIDIRDIFIFKISHIRFGLFTCIAIFSLLYFTFSKNISLKTAYRIMAGILAGWLFIFIFLVEALTGFVITFFIAFLLLFLRIWKKQQRTGKFVLILAAVSVPIIFFSLLNDVYEKNYSPRNETIDWNARTSQGNAYTFNFRNTEMENGYRVYIYMCDEELRRSWNMRSRINFDSLDKKLHPVKFTLIRFLASKGLRKDSVSVQQLTEKEIHSIERGIPNVKFQTPSIKVRLLQLMWEFDQYSKGGDPNGHSFMQRLESWRAALGVISSNPLFGVGTGDLPRQVFKQYIVMNSKLDSNHYLRPHNQYLAIAVAFGITGCFYFLFTLSYPLFFSRNRNYFYLVFFLIAIISMLTEDTLETQPGATFFAFFNALFLFGMPAISSKYPA
jgi:hypothetical protein